MVLKELFPMLQQKASLIIILRPILKKVIITGVLMKRTDAIILAAAGEYKAPAGYGSKKSKGIGLGTIFFILIILIAIFGGGRKEVVVDLAQAGLSEV